MSEAYKELLVKQEKQTTSMALGVLMIILACASFVGAMFFGPLCFIGVILFGILSYVLYFRRMKVEYEYTYMDKELRIDSIFNENNRKRVDTLDMSKLEILAPVKSHHLDSYKNRQTKVTDYSTKAEDTEEMKTYELYYSGERKIILSLTEEFVKNMRTTMPNKIKLDL